MIAVRVVGIDAVGLGRVDVAAMHLTNDIDAEKRPSSSLLMVFTTPWLSSIIDNK